VFGDAKNDVALDVLPSRRLAGNQLFTLYSMIAHNLSREVQMLAAPSASRARPKRPAGWRFEKLDTMRHRILQKTGRFTLPQGEMPLTMSAQPCCAQGSFGFSRCVAKSSMIIRT